VYYCFRCNTTGERAKTKRKATDKRRESEKTKTGHEQRSKMKRAERLQTPRSRQRSLCRVGVVIYFICAQWMPAVDSAFGSYNAYETAWFFFLTFRRTFNTSVPGACITVSCNNFVVRNARQIYLHVGYPRTIRNVMARRARVHEVRLLNNETVRLAIRRVRIRESN